MEGEVADVVFFSGGLSSWVLAKRVAERYGTERLTLLFTDTLIEDPDLYRFLKEGAANVGGHLEWIAEGRTPFEVFRDVKLLGNSWKDPCSRILKREIATKWVKDNYPDPTSVRLWLGMNWDEEHRLTRSKRFWEPYQMGSLLMEKPFLFQKDMIALLGEQGIKEPRLYAMGYPHNNCGGACIKAGQAHWRHLLKTQPDIYEKWEKMEDGMRSYLDKDVSILKESKNGSSHKLTLKVLRERTDKQIDLFDWGGCGCFVSEEENEEKGENHGR